MFCLMALIHAKNDDLPFHIARVLFDIVKCKRLDVFLVIESNVLIVICLHQQSVCKHANNALCYVIDFLISFAYRY